MVRAVNEGLGGLVFSSGKLLWLASGNPLFHPGAADKDASTNAVRRMLLDPFTIFVSDSLYESKIYGLITLSDLACVSHVWHAQVADSMCVMATPRVISIAVCRSGFPSRNFFSLDLGHDT